MNRLLARSLAAFAVAGVASASLVAPAQASSSTTGSGSASASTNSSGSAVTASVSLNLGITVGDKLAPTGAPTGPLGYALTSDAKIATFSLADPTKTSSVALRGIPSGAKVVGIDERPRTGVLYAVVRNADKTGAAYTVDPATGVATKAFDLRGIGSTLLLEGDAFGVDFNPVPDALRITSSAGQNLRVLPSDRVVATIARTAGDTFIDATLSYDPITATTRTPATGIVNAAYTNSVAAPTTTQLFNVDVVRSQLTLQNPPNDGTQTAVAPVALQNRPTGGFDIATTGSTNTFYLVTRNNRVAATVSNPIEKLLVGLGLAKPRVDQRAVLSTLDPTTGALTTVGAFVTNTIVDVAVDTPTP